MRPPTPSIRPLLTTPLWPTPGTRWMRRRGPGSLSACRSNLSAGDLARAQHQGGVSESRTTEMLAGDRHDVADESGVV